MTTIISVLYFTVTTASIRVIALIVTYLENLEISAMRSLVTQEVPAVDSEYSPRDSVWKRPADVLQTCLLHAAPTHYMQTNITTSCFEWLLHESAL